jgi:hypothetical protein
VFVLADSFFEFARRCSLNPPLDPQTVGLSIGGRAVPDYGAPFNQLRLELARCWRYQNHAGCKNSLLDSNSYI